MFWTLSWPFTYIKVQNIFSYKQDVRKSVFENTGTGFSSLEILQEPESREDQLK